MTEDNVRFHAQRALAALGTIDKNSKARRPELGDQLMWAIEDCRKHLFKLAGTNSNGDDQSRLDVDP